MVSTHMLNKTSLSKPPKILEKKPFKHLFKVNHRFDKFVVYYHCLFANFQSLITTIGTLTHLLELIKQTIQGVYINTTCFYLEKKQINKSLIGIISLK